MSVVLDTGILYAIFDRRDEWHERGRKMLEEEQGTLILPAPVIPEVDYLLFRKVGRPAQAILYRVLAKGQYFIADLQAEKYARVEEINRRFSDLGLGFVDAAVVAISEALGVPRIATTDRRHFTPLAAALGLELLP